MNKIEKTRFPERISKYFRKSGFGIGCWLFLPILLFILSGVIGCAPAHVRHRIEKVSRDYTYIDFLENQHPFKIVSSVGGEHMSFYKVLGFEKDEFSVTFTALYGLVFFGLSGEGVHIESRPVSGAKKKIVKVEAMETIFTIDLSAYPYGEYQLQIEKLHPASTQKR